MNRTTHLLLLVLLIAPASGCRFVERMRSMTRDHRPAQRIARLTDIDRWSDIAGRAPQSWAKGSRELALNSVRTLRIPKLAQQEFRAAPIHVLRVQENATPRVGIIAADAWRDLLNLPRRANLLRSAPMDASDPDRYTGLDPQDPASVRSFAGRLLDRVRID